MTITEDQFRELMSRIEATIASMPPRPDVSDDLLDPVSRRLPPAESFRSAVTTDLPSLARSVNDGGTVARTRMAKLKVFQSSLTPVVRELHWLSQELVESSSQLNVTAQPFWSDLRDTVTNQLLQKGIGKGQIASGLTVTPSSVNERLKSLSTQACKLLDDSVKINLRRMGAVYWAELCFDLWAAPEQDIVVAEAIASAKQAEGKIDTALEDVRMQFGMTTPDMPACLRNLRETVKQMRPQLAIAARAMQTLRAQAPKLSSDADPASVQLGTALHRSAELLVVADWVDWLWGWPGEHPIRTQWRDRSHLQGHSPEQAAPQSNFEGFVDGREVTVVGRIVNIEWDPAPGAGRGLLHLVDSTGTGIQCIAAASPLTSTGVRIGSSAVVTGTWKKALDPDGQPAVVIEHNNRNHIGSEVSTDATTSWAFWCVDAIRAMTGLSPSGLKMACSFDSRPIEDSGDADTSHLVSAVRFPYPERLGPLEAAMACAKADRVLIGARNTAREALDAFSAAQAEATTSEILVALDTAAVLACNAELCFTPVAGPAAITSFAFSKANTTLTLVADISALVDALRKRDLAKSKWEEAKKKLNRVRHEFNSYIRSS